jgi:DNA-directed RNA polymerase delta subunit
MDGRFVNLGDNMWALRENVLFDDISGILVPAENVVTLREKMIFLKNDDEKRLEIAKNGRIRAEKYFYREYMMNNYLIDVNELTDNIK